MTTRQDAGARTMRCGACGGLNLAGARWCGQCLERFDAPPPPPGVAPATSSGVAPATSSRVAPAPPLVAPAPAAVAPLAPTPGRPLRAAGPGAASGGGHGVVRVSDERLSWVCARCDADNDFGARSCAVCGSAFADSLRGAEPSRPARDPNTAALLSLLLPGAGHAYAGHWPQAIARAVLSLWAILATGVAVWQRGAPGSTVLLVWYGLAAFGLWAVGAHDAYRAASGRDDLSLLRGRAFLYVVLGLLTVLVLSVVSAVAAAPGA